MDLHYFPCFEVESYYIDNKDHESFHYHGDMKVDLENKVYFGQDGKIWPYQKIAKYEEISGELNNISGICATSYPPKCYLDVHSLEKSHFNLNIKEAFGSGSEAKPDYVLSTHVDLHFDLNNSNQEVKIFSGKDENGNLFFLKLKEGKCK
ncbi:hypothetical protein [Candidatus Mesenet endosymbiont of Phosphuga atrata]|uniref:hypothetical protein n=1 Tax=Candidatus Mesenet endosymbiont of Phosphuga atrata TaxID=3066221 RepID=UPI0030D1E3AB